MPVSLIYAVSRPEIGEPGGVWMRDGRQFGRTIHDEFRPARYRAEFSDDQLVADERKVIQHVALEVFRIFGIVIVRIVAYDNIRIAVS